MLLNLPASGSPVILQIANQARTEMAQRLFPSIDSTVSAKNIQRLDRNPQGPAVGNRTDSASACQHRHRAIDRRIHVLCSNDLVTDQAAFGTVALQAPLGL